MRIKKQKPKKAPPIADAKLVRVTGGDGNVYIGHPPPPPPYPGG